MMTVEDRPRASVNHYRILQQAIASDLTSEQVKIRGNNTLMRPQRTQLKQTMQNT